MLKIEDLKVGDVVVNKETGTESIVLSISLKFSHIYVGDGRFILSKNFTYFKKKEQSQYTFDDLIDVAVQAYKDNCTSRVVLEERGVCIHANGNAYGFYRDSKSIADGINFIQSLYKETFVIETIDSISKVNVGAIITLLNGKSSKVTSLHVLGDSLCVDDSDYALDFFVLKGATVEQ